MKKLTLLLSLVLCTILGACGEKEEPVPPAGTIDFTVKADGAKVTLEWTADGKAYDIWRAYDAVVFEKVAEGVKESPYVETLDVADNTEVTYRMVEKGGYPYSQEVKMKEQSVRIGLMTDDELLDLVQAATLKYFYDFAEPNSKMARERDASGDVVTTGGTGFGIMALIAGAERGFITRDQAYGHIRTITDFLMRVERFHGVYAHWYNGSNGTVKPFSQKDDGGDVIETAFLMQGLLTAKEYFGNGNAEEKKLADDIEEIWKGVEWSFYTQGKNCLTWHWSKNYGFEMNLDIRGWNEGLIAYVLAAASPTYPITKDVYVEGFTSNGGIKNGRTYYDIVLPLGSDGEKGGPLFFCHYSFLGLDPRGLKDHVCNDYFEQNKAHTLINRAYCIDNPKNHVGYSENFWGLTASDCPIAGYIAHAPGNNDNGTVTPTAALSSMPYAPEECMAVLKYLYRDLGDIAFGEYGFYDAINLGANDKVVESYLAIDQGPIVAMIENYRSQLLWNLFMQNEDVQRGLKLLGFTSPYIH